MQRSCFDSRIMVMRLAVGPLPLRAPMDWLRKRDVYIDDDHVITGMDVYCGPTVRPQWRERVLPDSPCTARIAKADGNPLFFISDRDEIGALHVIR